MRNYCLAAAKWPSRRPLVHSRHTVREAHHVHHSALDVTRGTAASATSTQNDIRTRAGGRVAKTLARGGARRRKKAGASRHTGVASTGADGFSSRRTLGGCPHTRVVTRDTAWCSRGLAFLFRNLNPVTDRH